jgi:hypothetical protein
MKGFTIESNVLPKSSEDDKEQQNKKVTTNGNMNEIEATEILAEQIRKLKAFSYDDLCKRIDKEETFEVIGMSGVKYQLEFQFMWDDKPNNNLRVWVNIDDFGPRVYFPMTKCFIISPKGKFIGE